MNPKDPSNFRQFILDTPNQFKVGMDLAKNAKVEGNFDKVVVSGMGGSALPANLLRIYLNSLFEEKSSIKKFEVFINRYYKLPYQAKESTSLNLLTSYSGNTEETISSLEEVKSLSLPFIGFSSGGKVEELCKSYSMPHIKLPVPYPNYQPRMGTGYFFGSMIQVLINHNLIPDISLQILQEAEKFHTFMKEYENRAKDFSKKIVGKTPVVYASPKFKSVAMIWKIKFNENSKTPAFWNFFPELSHNEMVGYTNPQSKFITIMLKDKNDLIKNLNRYDATSKLLSEVGIESEIIEMDGDTDFSKIFLSITLVDWISYYLALEYGNDPTPVDMVEKLKKILASL